MTRVDESGGEVPVSGHWAREYPGLTSAAGAVLTAMTVLDLAELTTTELAALLDVPSTVVVPAVEELRQAGWLTNPAPGSAVLAAEARVWLFYDTTDIDIIGPDGAAIAARAIVRQMAGLGRDHHGRPAGVQYAEANKTAVVTALRAGVRMGLYDQAVLLAAAAWRVAAAVDDPSWWDELAEHGERAAIAARRPVALIELLRQSAEVFAGAGDAYQAIKQHVRALSLAYKLGDHGHDRDDGHGHIVTGLTALIELYHDHGQPEGAADALLELASLHRTAGNPVPRAEALAELGSVLLAAGRPARAEDYLGRADDILAGEAAVSPLLRARVAEQRGRALRQTGGIIRARRCFQRALPVAADADPALSERVRALLTPRGSDHPTDERVVRFVRPTHRRCREPDTTTRFDEVIT